MKRVLLTTTVVAGVALVIFARSSAAPPPWSQRDEALGTKVHGHVAKLSARLATLENRDEIIVTDIVLDSGQIVTMPGGTLDGITLSVVVDGIEPIDQINASDLKPGDEITAVVKHGEAKRIARGQK